MMAVSKAVGISRTPDTELVKRPNVIHARLLALRAEVSKLEEKEILAVHSPEDVEESTVDKAWQPILAAFRVLTMSATASGMRLDPAFTASLYETAADAALLSGNLDVYLSCQSRLLGDLYPEIKPAPERVDEFTGYNLLYFGVFSPDTIELAAQSRRLKADSAGVVFALKVIVCVRTQNGIGFLNHYKTATKRQKSIMKPRLSEMRDIAARTIIRTYLILETEYARKLLHASNETVFETILAQNTGLASLNTDTTAPLIFLRLPKL